MTEIDIARSVWVFMILCEHEIQSRKPGITLIEKEKTLGWIIDTTCLGDNKVCVEEGRKITHVSLGGLAVVAYEKHCSQYQ